MYIVRSYNKYGFSVGVNNESRVSEAFLLEWIAFDMNVTRVTECEDRVVIIEFQDGVIVARPAY